MGTGSYAYINPEMLKLAREQCGYSIEQAVKTHLTPEKLEKAERGEVRLTFKQFLTLANKYKRPPAFFYLKSPPEEEFPEDFRTIQAGEIKFGPILREHIKKIKEKRKLAITYQLYDQKFDYSYIKLITIDSKPESVANIILKFLKIDMKTRASWKTKYDAFNKWKNVIEEKGILVFQISGVSVRDEMRGFSISEIPYPTIVLNRSDSPLGRIFTLIHELCHLMLKKGGICTTKKVDEDQFEIERFCNAVAGAVLVPKADLLDIRNIENYDSSKTWTDIELDQLKKIFWASYEVILRRLLNFNKTNKKFYQKKRNEWQRLPLPAQRGGPPPYKKVLSGNSRNYIRIVLDAMYEGQITMHEASYYLDMNLKYLSKLEENLQS